MATFFKYYNGFLAGVFFVLFSCGSNKYFIKKGEINPKMSIKKLNKELRKTPEPVNHFFARGSIKYQKGSKSLTLGVSVSVQRDTMIGMSFSFWGMTMAKIKITPKKISYYEKREGTYFEGGYQKIRSLLKMPVDFEMIQNIFLARKILPTLKPDRLDINEKNYLLHYEHKKENIILDVWINAFLRVTRQMIIDTKMKNTLSLQYHDFKMVGKDYLPYVIKINAKNSTENISLKLLYKTVRKTKASNDYFKYNIPPNFKRIH